MLSNLRSPLGAPGVFALPQAPLRTLHPQRLDAAAFFGVAPRGPARVPVAGGVWPDGAARVLDGRPVQRSVPVAVHSFDEYQFHFGGFEGPGLLPHGVAAYFEQGGRLAFVVRIVPAGAFDLGCARGTLPAGALSQPIDFIARNAGRWGDALRVHAGFDTENLTFAIADGAAAIDMPLSNPIAVGSTLRWTDAIGQPHLAVCSALSRVREPARARERWRVALEPPPAEPPRRIELVTLRLDVDDGAGRREHFEGLGLAPDHPRGLAAVLCGESTLLWPAPAWAGTLLWPRTPAVDLLRAAGGAFAGGSDGYAAIGFDDFFDADWSEADDVPGGGITSVAGLSGVTQLVLPDLYVPAQWAGPAQISEQFAGNAGADFADCVAITSTPAAEGQAPSALTGLIIDPRRSDGLDAIGELQQRVLDFCEQTQDHIALLDAPPGLSLQQLLRWRARFDASWIAGYHPWLLGARRALDAAGDTLARPRQLPPSAVAAGIVARRELTRGIQFGPANEVARQVLAFAEPQDAARADALHPQGVNCFVREPAGIVLAGARTLSRETDWRQLSVRRLVLMLRRTLLAQTQWAVFEPNGPALWRDLQRAIESLLRGLFRAGAFAGRTEAESFFVRLDTSAPRLDRGELVVEIGVAPAEPMEFILVRLRRDGDGTLELEE